MLEKKFLEALISYLLVSWCSTMVKIHGTENVLALSIR